MKQAVLQQEVMEHVLSILYGVSGVTASALYVPQIIKYHRERDACMSISIVTWSGWVLITAITILYALCVVKSYLFASVAALNVVAQLAVLTYGVRARLMFAKCCVTNHAARG